MTESEREMMRKQAIAAFECRYYYEDLGVFRVFDNAKEVLLKALLQETDNVSYKNIDRWAAGNGQLQSALKKIRKNRFGNVTVIDGFGEEAPILPADWQEKVKGIRAVQTETALEIIPGIAGVFDYYKTCGKDGQDHIRGLAASENTAFVCRDKLNGYAETYFSIALKSPEFSFALYTMPNNLPIKGTALLGVTLLLGDTLYVENAAKYFDITPYVAGLRS